MYLKAGRFGPYVQEGVHDDETGFKPRTASLFKDMDPATVTLEDVLPLLDLPREVGVDPADGEMITAPERALRPVHQEGHATRRSLEAEQQILTVDLDEALRLFAEPKRRGRGGRQAAAQGAGPGPGHGAARSWSRTAGSAPT